jgi:hypothetical protein
VYDPPMTFTILSDRWVGNTGCPAKSSTKGGHPNCNESSEYLQGGEFLDQASDYRLFKTDSNSREWFFTQAVLKFLSASSISVMDWDAAPFPVSILYSLDSFLKTLYPIYNPVSWALSECAGG